MTREKEKSYRLLLSVIELSPGWHAIFPSIQSIMYHIANRGEVGGQQKASGMFSKEWRVIWRWPMWSI